MSTNTKRIEKRALGRVHVAGQPMPWLKGVVAGDFVFLAGTAGETDDAGQPVRSIEEQTALAFARAQEALLEAGSTLERAVRINQYLSDRTLRTRYVAARQSWLEANVPALMREPSFASLLVIQELADEAMLIEIEVTALVG